MKLQTWWKEALITFPPVVQSKGERYLTFDSQGMSLDKKFEEILLRIFFMFIYLVISFQVQIYVNMPSRQSNVSLSFYKTVVELLQI